MNGHSFWDMGGFAIYVWPCFALALLVLIWNWWEPRRRRAALLKELQEKYDPDELRPRTGVRV